MKRYHILLLGVFMLLSISSFAQVNVTFSVDMSVYWSGNSFNPVTDTVRISGDFNGWSTTANDLAKGTGADSAVYSVQIGGITEGSHSYKFIFINSSGVQWEGDPNRSATIGTNDTTLATVQFNSITGKLNNVWFKVDMSHVIGTPSFDFDPATDTVVVTGDFTNWPDWGPRDASAVTLTYNPADSVFSGLADSLASGQTIKFKFIYLNGNINWETISDRSYFVPEQDSSTFSAFWDNIDPNAQPFADGNILFVVDMSVANELGVFNPSVDSVQIRGEFNGWGDTDPARSLLNQDPGDPNVWFLNIPFVQQVLNDTLIYKYFIKNGSGSTPYSNTGWEVAISPTPAGNRDRPVIFMGQPDQVQEYQYFEGIHTDWVIPTGTTVEATFSVDMTPATGFDPAVDSVVWVPRQPFYFAVHNIPWPGDQPRVLYLTDSNSDMVYEGTLTINGPDFNGFLYNYGYVDVSATNTLVQEGGSQEECRVRYVQQTGPRTFVSPYSFPQDVWTDGGQKPEEETPTSVEEISGAIPNKYSLEQNYPNPFNPTTTIRFSIPEAGRVSLSIYNLLGEKVEEILNQELVTNTYEITYDASNLSSGVYFYTIKTANFISTKKMLLMK